MPIAKIAGPVVGAAMSLTIAALSVSRAVAAWGQVEQHPSFQNALGTADFLGQWGDGDFYFHETDANGESVIGPGETHRTVYISENPANNWTEQEIADAEFGGNTASVTANWLKNQSFYGGDVGNALDRQMGARIRSAIATRPSAQSVWFSLERGYDYGETMWLARGASGQSPLHPYVVMSHGAGAKPDIGYNALFLGDLERNIVVRNVNSAPAPGTFHEPQFYGLTNLLFEDVEFSGGMIDVQSCTAISRYRCGMINSIRLVPKSGSDWKTPDIPTAANADRTSGTFVSECTGILELDNYLYHNGWADNRDTVDFQYNAGANGQPPTQFSHNVYHQFDNNDTTIQGCVSFEPASSHFQVRSGANFWDQVMVNGNIAANLSGGEPVAGPQIGTGDYSLAADNLIHISQYLLSGNGTLYGAGNWGIDNGGLGQVATLEENIAAHYYNPDNSAEQTAKDAIAPTTGSGGAFTFNNSEHRDTSIIWNWQANPNSPNTNVDGLNPTTLNETTVQRYAADVLGLGDTSARGFALHVIAQPRPAETAREFLNWFRGRFGLAPVNSARSTPQTVVFSPWPHAEGFRWDNRRNWSTGYVPIDGDTVDLASQDVRHPRHTTRLAALNFGSGNTLHITGGLIGADAVSSGVITPVVNLSRAGQFHVGGHSAASGLQVNLTDGRFFNQGTITQGFSLTGSSFAELILATTGGAFTLAAGESLTLTGGDVLCGFDGTDGGAASVTFTGTVNMNAASGALPQIREFRSGMWGETPTSVASTITCGGTLNVDVTGVAPGTYDLIIADTVTGTFDTVAVTGGSGSVSYTATAVRITVT